MLSIKKIWEGFSKINRISQIIIKAGSVAALVFLLIGTARCFYLLETSDTFYTEFYLATQVIKTAVMMFAEALMGAVLFDYIASHRAG